MERGEEVDLTGVCPWLPLATRLPDGLLREFGAGPTDGARRMAHSAFWQACLGDLGVQAAPQGGPLAGIDHRKFTERCPDQIDRRRKTEAVGVNACLQCRLMHERAHDVMGQQQAVEFLDDATRRLAA